MSDIDTNVPAALQRIIPLIKTHRQCANNDRPFVLGLTGPQGSGKSTWANVMVRELQQKHGYNVLTLSIDDLYRNHDDLVHLRETNSQNKLLRTRGQPGTHDEELAMGFFENVRRHSQSGSTPIKIPVFDKSKFNGEGDRLSEDQWPVVEPGKKLDVLVFEGWCLGFRPLPEDTVKQKWEAAQNNPHMTLGDHALAHVLDINRNLARYCETFTGPQHFDYLVQLDTEELSTVYTWRIQQEHALMKAHGSGMTDDEVITFVRGYMPAYELYMEGLREGFFRNSGLGSNVGNSKIQLRLLLDKSRAVVQIDEI